MRAPRPPAWLRCRRRFCVSSTPAIMSWLRGRCSACKTTISARYPLVEGLTSLLFAAVAWRFGPQPVALMWCAVVAVLLALTLIDWDTTVLPDALTLPLLWAALVAAALGWSLPLPQAVWGAVVGYLALWSVYWLFKLTTGKEGMGYGDFKLLAALGAWLGWQQLPVIIIFSSLVGAVLGSLYIAMNKSSRSMAIPFGPYLAGAGLITLFWGELIVDNYLQFAGLR